MAKKADLHVRTTRSMGRVTPTEAVALAKKRGVAAIAIVDHESVEGIPEAVEAGESYGVEVIPGIELMYEEGPREAHVIGYFIDWRNPTLLREIARSQAARAWRVQRSVEELQKLGIKISHDDVMREAGDAAILGRTHVASLLVKQKVVRNMREAFERFLGYGAPAYIPKYQLPLKEVMRSILDAGGIPALAHPKFSRGEELVPEFVKYGLRGIEVYHPHHTSKETKRFKKLAEKYHLIEVGGTDSEAKKPPVGTVTVSYDVVEELKRGWKEFPEYLKKLLR
jgi:hypothetical protein